MDTAAVIQHSLPMFKVNTPMFCIPHRYCWFGESPVAQVPEASLSGLQGLGTYVPLTKVGALNKVRSQYDNGR
jgi:hypothetical protein